MKCKHTHKDAPDNSVCEECYKPFNSEYHISDECVNIDEDERDQWNLILKSDERDFRLYVCGFLIHLLHGVDILMKGGAKDDRNKKRKDNS